MTDNKNKSYNPGDLVYYPMRENGKMKIDFGIVVESNWRQTKIERYVYRDRRLINGIPINSLPDVGEWRDLPEGWTTDSPPFELAYEEVKPWELYLDMTNIEDVMQAIENAILIPKQFSQGIKDITAEIAEDKYRLKKEFFEDTDNYIELPTFMCCEDFAAADIELEAYTNNLKEIIDKLDYELSKFKSDE